MKTIKAVFLFPILSLALASGFVSCEENADVDLPDLPSKLVVISFLSPQDTLISVRVTKSEPLFQSSQVDVNHPVTDATVRISGNSTSVLLSYDIQSGLYTAPSSAFTIFHGSEYSIEVSAPNMETVTASTMVPAAVPNNFTASMSYTLDTADPYQWIYSIHTQTAFTDLSGEGNLYRLSKRIINVPAFSQDTGSWLVSDELFNDHNAEGQLVNRTDDLQFYSTSPSVGNMDIITGMSISLVHCSKEYYYYHTSLSNYNGGGDPFSEPTLIYTNVKNGYGVFAGCSYSVKRFNF